MILKRQMKRRIQAGVRGGVKVFGKVVNLPLKGGAHLVVSPAEKRANPKTTPLLSLLIRYSESNEMSNLHQNG